MTGNPGVAVIVPVHGDAAALERLLVALAAWPRRPTEIVVACAGRDVAVAALADAHGCRLIEAPANRGAQLDAGARAALADVLWFVHADVEPPAMGVELIAGAIAAGHEAGCFRFAFQGQASWRSRLIERLVALRIALGGIPYGDQSLFVRRESYLAVGGFEHVPLFEEVRLVRALRRRAHFATLPATVRVSTRRWDRDGWWRRSLGNRWLALRHMLGATPAALARDYGYTRPASKEEAIR